TFYKWACAPAGWMLTIGFEHEGQSIHREDNVVDPGKDAAAPRSRTVSQSGSSQRASSSSSSASPIMGSSASSSARSSQSDLNRSEQSKSKSQSSSPSGTPSPLISEPPVQAPYPPVLNSRKLTLEQRVTI